MTTTVSSTTGEATTTSSTTGAATTVSSTTGAATTVSSTTGEATTSVGVPLDQLDKTVFTSVPFASALA